MPDIQPSRGDRSWGFLAGLMGQSFIRLASRRLRSAPALQKVLQGREQQAACGRHCWHRHLAGGDRIAGRGRYDSRFHAAA